MAQTKEEKAAYMRSWREKNKDRRRKYAREWKRKNTDRTHAHWLKWHAKNKTKDNIQQRERYADRCKRMPWRNVFYIARARCNDPANSSYRYYGGKGIRFMLTMEDIIFLWLRDGADTLEKPSIDRIDCDGHYELSNCQFIEMIDNIKRAWEYRRSKSQ